MAMGKRQRQRQEPLFVCTADLRPAPAHPYYQVVHALLAAHGFDEWVEAACQPFYAEVLGRPSLPPGVYFRCLFIGYFEGLDSERGIAWRVADSLSLRSFLGLGLTEDTPDHSTLSRTRRLIDLETHQRVFVWILKLLARQDLLDGQTVGVDATTLEANAALRSIVRRDTGQSYPEFLTELAQASGIATPTREDLARLDQERKHKAANADWQNPHEPDARIAKMKDGRTHLAHKDEHAVDMRTGAVVAVTLQPADQGDTTTWLATVEQAWGNLSAVADDPLTAPHVQALPVQELVQDKGYHSNQTLTDYRELGVRSYVAEPRRGRRQWAGQTAARDAVYANRRRIRGQRGRRLMRQRGELIERSFAHCYGTGGMRRTHLRGHPNILKRLFVHVAGFNLSLILRKLLPRGTLRGFQDLGAAARAALGALGAAVTGLWAARRARGARSRHLADGWRIPHARSAPLRQAA